MAETQVVEFLKGMRGTVYATVLREMKNKNIEPSNESVIQVLKDLKAEWEKDTSDTSREKLLYIAVMTEEIDMLEAKLAKLKEAQAAHESN